MSRSAPWRRVIPELVAQRIDEARNMRMFLVQENGPTSFVLKAQDTEKKYKVSIGDTHYCSCNTNKSELCVHILFALLKILRVSPVNPLIWQQSLIESEIEQIMRGRFRPAPKPPKKKEKHVDTSAEPSVERREVDEGECCPICQEDMEDTDVLAWCQFGCGNNVHGQCMKVWAEHRKSLGEDLTCPLCRSAFPVSQLAKVSTHGGSTSKAWKVACSGCRQNGITGPLHKCSVCVEYFLCSACFKERVLHQQHPFLMRNRGEREWAPAERTIAPALPPAMIQDLQSRDIGPDDYDALLALDNPEALPQAATQTSSRQRPARRPRPPRQSSGRTDRPQTDGAVTMQMREGVPRTGGQQAQGSTRRGLTSQRNGRCTPGERMDGASLMGGGLFTVTKLRSDGDAGEQENRDNNVEVGHSSSATSKEDKLFRTEGHGGLQRESMRVNQTIGGSSKPPIAFGQRTATHGRRAPARQTRGSSGLSGNPVPDLCVGDATAGRLSSGVPNGLVPRRRSMTDRKVSSSNSGQPTLSLSVAPSFAYVGSGD